jgi:hypothetical protein
MPEMALYRAVYILHGTMVQSRARIQIAKPDIVRFFDELPRKVFKGAELAGILEEQRGFWRLAQNTSVGRFMDFLTENGKLRELKFPFPHRRERRFVWGNVPLLEVLLTLGKNAYFTHYTAVRLHGLTEQVPKIIYLNHEQRPHNPTHDLEQSRIDAAFRHKPRISQNVISFGDVRVCLVNGMYTNQLGVISEKLNYDGDPVNVRVTNLERTLIDIVVRPQYAGGVSEVLKAYELAKDRVSVNRLAATLEKLGYVYPYHQAIGFYLEKAGYKPSELELLKRFPIEFNFYLTHQMAQPDFNKRWKLYIPKGF